MADYDLLTSGWSVGTYESHVRHKLMGDVQGESEAATDEGTDEGSSSESEDGADPADDEEPMVIPTLLHQGVIN